MLQPFIVLTTVTSPIDINGSSWDCKHMQVVICLEVLIPKTLAEALNLKHINNPLD